MSRKSMVKERKDQILDALYSRIAKCGYENTTIEDIAKEAGVAKGAVHYYFENKEGILFDLAKKRIEEGITEVIPILVSDNNPEQKLKNMISFLLENREERRSNVAVFVNFLGQSYYKEEINNFLKQFYRGFRQVIKMIIEEGIEKGLFKRVDSAQVALVIISLFHGIILQEIIDPDEVPIDKIKKDVENLILSILRK